MTNKEALELLDKHNMCHKCQKAKQLHNRKFCARCLEKIALNNMKRYDAQKAHEYQARRREIYQEKKATGICVRCTKPATYGMYCYEHSIEAHRRSAKRAQIRKNERHDRGLIPEYRAVHNLCCYCGKPVEEPRKHGRACNACAAMMREHSMRADKSYWKSLNDLRFAEMEYK